MRGASRPKDTRSTSAARTWVCVLFEEWPAARTRLLRPEQHPHLEALLMSADSRLPRALQVNPGSASQR